MAVTFSQYYDLMRGIDMMEMPVDPAVLQSRVQKTLAKGHAYAGETEPGKDDPEIGNVFLAAACVGKKPACAILPGQLGDDPENMGFAISNALIQHGMKARPDLTIKKIEIPGFMPGWTLIGGKSAVEELHELLRLQYELMVQTSPELASIPDEEKRHHVGDIIRGAKKCSSSKWGQEGYSCAPLHRRIGQLFGYDPSSIESHASGLPLKHVPNLPAYTNMPDSMKPHLGPPVPVGYNLGNDERKESYDPFLHMLIYEGFLFIPGVSRPVSPARRR